MVTEETGGRGPLCPNLYEALVEAFGEVRIINPGEALDATPEVDPATGRVNWDIVQQGEHYFVNCPFCNDTKQRLSISYCYGQVDRLTNRAALWLAHCFNEECVSRDTPFGLDNRLDLERKIFGFVNREDRIGKYKTLPAYVAPRELSAVELPGDVVTLDTLPPSHAAVQYLEGRGYDAARLGRRLGVGYCTSAGMQYPAARGRIIIPIVMDGVRVGWQGRYAGDVDWKARHIPKYYNLPRMHKSLMLYNVDRASKSRVVAVVEGVASVWALGDAAVAVLGHDVSQRQFNLICERWAKEGGLVALILDPDAAAKAKATFGRLEKAFAAAGGAAVLVRMPDGKDPGDYTREAAWGKIYEAGDAQGIDVEAYIRG